jgi:polygalacturonase
VKTYLISIPILGVFAIASTSLFAADAPASASPAPSPAPSVKSPAQFNVRDYGAKGDNATKDTDAFQKALDACAAAGGGEVDVPAGNYIIGSVEMHSNTTLHLDKDVFVIESPDIADYPLITGRFEGATTQIHRGMIFANQADHIAITGPGGFVPTSALGTLRNPRAPIAIEMMECQDVVFDGFSLQYDRPANTQIWCIHPNYCTNMLIKGLYIRSQGTNGDGIDVDSDSNVVVENCDISAGDDAISIKSGRGMDAVRIGRPSENILIKDSTLRSVHFAALGFGTEISGGVRNVTVSNCTISGVQNAVFIKSRDGRGGFMENISLDNITVDQSPTFIGIDLMSKGTQASEPVPGDIEKWTHVSNLRFTNIKVNNVRALVETQASRVGPGVAPERPIEGLTLANITGTCQRGITLTNIVNANFSGIAVTGFSGNLLNLTNVTGTGLDDPAKASPTAAPAATTAAP